MQPSTHELETPQPAKLVEFSAHEWTHPVCLRVEVYGCEIKCDGPLGMESGEITDTAIVASSHLTSHPPASGRLGGRGWCAQSHDLFQYLQIELPETSKVTHVAVKGVGDSWVTAYNFQWSRGGYFYRQYPEQMHGNVDGESVVKVKLATPATARYLRIVPTAIHTALCLRVEIYGCSLSAIYPLAGRSEGGLAEGSKVGIVVVFLLLVVGVVVAGLVYYRRKRKGGGGGSYSKTIMKRVTEGRIRVKDDEVQIISNEVHNEDDEDDEDDGGGGGGNIRFGDGGCAEYHDVPIS